MSATQRRYIAADAEAKQAGIIADALAGGFAFDWPRILSAARTGMDDMEREVRRQIASAEFVDTLEALALHGVLLARYILQRHERLAGLRDQAPVVVFADAEPFTSLQALRRWLRILNLQREEVDLLKAGTRALFDSEEMRERIGAKVTTEVENLYGAVIEEGLTENQFVQRALELMPDRAEALLRTEYATTLTDIHTGALEEQVRERAATFPFLQFIALKDSRTTWWICYPMGTAGPGGTGYIAATDDDIWRIWRPPCHFGCRSTISPIGYKEAQRLGILAADGVTKIAIRGGNPYRPFGDPPDFAESPFNGELRRVEPQDGFGA